MRKSLWDCNEWMHHHSSTDWSKMNIAGTTAISCLVSAYLSAFVLPAYHVKTVYQDDSCHTQEHEHPHICSSLCYSLDSTRWSFSGDKELFNVVVKLRKEILLGYCAKFVKLRQGGRTYSLPPMQGSEWAMGLSSTDTFPRGREPAEYKYCRQWVTEDDVIDLCKDCRVWIWWSKCSQTMMCSEFICFWL